MKRKQIFDVTGTPLNPSRQGEQCPGNGNHPEYECCCDECGYYLYCFPQFDKNLKKLPNKKFLKARLKSSHT